MNHSANTLPTPHYFVPQPSAYPALAALGLFFVILGAGQWLNDAPWGKWSLALGLVFFLGVLFQWFSQSVSENQSGLYGRRIDFSYRWSMSWFIFSEVMFFGAFFTALWWVRSHSVPELANAEHALLWPDVKAVWPTVANNATASPAGTVEAFQVMTPFWLPTINTALLLASGITITAAHHALLKDQRTQTLVYMWLTIALAVVFLGLQSYEYIHAYSAMNLKLTSGVYGSTFYLLTGFHGFHVFIGMLMLLFVTLRIHRGHFTSTRHFAFEGAAWYWHFVDVVWLGLYVVVYWL